MKYVFEYNEFLKKYKKWYRSGEKGVAGSFFDCKERYKSHDYNMSFTPDYKNDEFIIFESDKQFCGGDQLNTIFVSDAFNDKYLTELMDNNEDFIIIYFLDTCAAIKLKQYGYDYAISKEEYSLDELPSDYTEPIHYNELIYVKDHTMKELKENLFNYVNTVKHNINLERMWSDLLKIKGYYNKEVILYDSKNKKF